MAGGPASSNSDRFRSDLARGARGWLVFATGIGLLEALILSLAAPLAFAEWVDGYMSLGDVIWLAAFASGVLIFPAVGWVAYANGRFRTAIALGSYPIALFTIFMLSSFWSFWTG
jgi:hypothetical protein